MLVETLKKDVRGQILAVLFIGFTLWWLALQFNLVVDYFQSQLFGALYGIVALFGALFGFGIAQKWGGVKSILGRAIFMFSLGLLAQEFGQLTYSYYTFFARIEIPYPSLGDVGYFGSIAFYIYGTLLLAKMAGVKVSLQSLRNKIQAVIVSAILLGYSYWVFLRSYKFDLSKPLTIFLDFGYPLGQAIYVSIAILAVFLSRGVLGGVMKYRILFVFFALLVQYLSDFTFLYQAHLQTAAPGGIVDYMYLCSYLLMSLAILELRLSQVRAKISN